jgi:hypothetical protein
MKEGKKPGTLVLPHGMILLECKEFGIFMEDDPSGIQHASSFGIIALQIMTVGLRWNLSWIAPEQIPWTLSRSEALSAVVPSCVS